MKHLSILLPRGKINLMKLLGAKEFFTIANTAFSTAGKKPLFNVQIIGEDNYTTEDGTISIFLDSKLVEVIKTDLIIIPAMDDISAAVIEKNRSLIEWIQIHHAKGSQVASMCTGAFLLAATGLLNNRSCTTHWSAAGYLQRMFPQITVTENKIYTEEGRLYTSAGSFSSFNLLAFLVEKFYDRETALSCAKGLQLDLTRRSQSQFAIFNGYVDHDDPEVAQVQDLLENRDNSSIRLGSLAEKCGLHTRNLERRFKKATGLTIIEYSKRLKIERAKNDLDRKGKNLTEIMLDSGYADMKAFRNAFVQVTGLSPAKYRDMYK